jgi:hypothetical protein
MSLEALGIVLRDVRPLILRGLLLLGMLGCAGPSPAMAAPSFACSSALGQFAVSLGENGRLVSPLAMNSVFGR